MACIDPGATASIDLRFSGAKGGRVRGLSLYFVRVGSIDARYLFSVTKPSHFDNIRRDVLLFQKELIDKVVKPAPS